MRLVRLLPLFASLLAATLGHAESLTPDATLTRTLKGGVAVDGWGDTSTELTFATGSFQIQLPAGATVEDAILVSATVNKPSGPNIPAGPASFPRVVVLGSGVDSTTRVLEGTPDEIVAGSAAFGSWFTSATATVKAAIGATASGGVVNIPVSERGDSALDEFKIAGHTLIVVYSHPSAPLRNVLVALGAAGNTFFDGTSSSTLALPSAALICGEPAALSLSDIWEFNVWTERSVITINGNTISTTAGGADEFVGVAAGTGQGGATGGLLTVGSFGGGGAAMVGAPLGLKGDSVTALPTPPRLDDELYDINGPMPDGATSFVLGLANTTDAEFLSAVVLQTLARVSPTDADGDGLLDSAEAACPTDSDADGTPNLLDPDSDNDCLGDAVDPAPTLASGPSTTNCPSNASPICTGTGVTPSCGPCTATAQCTQRSAGTPVCSAGSCVAGPSIGAPTDGQTFVGAVTGSGTGPASSTLSLFGKPSGGPDFTLLTTIPVDGSGNWTVGPVPLSAGSYVVFVRTSVGGADTDSAQVSFNILDPVTPDLLPPSADLAVSFDLTSPPEPEPDLTAPPTVDLTPPVTVDLTPPVTVDLTPPVTVDLTPPATVDLTPPEGADLLPPEGADLKPVVVADLAPAQGADLLPPEGADLAKAPVDLAGVVTVDLPQHTDFAPFVPDAGTADLTVGVGSRELAGGGFGCSASGAESVSGLALLVLLALGSARRLAPARRRRR